MEKEKAFPGANLDFELTGGGVESGLLSLQMEISMEQQWL